MLSHMIPHISQRTIFESIFKNEDFFWLIREIYKFVFNIKKVLIVLIIQSADPILHFFDSIWAEGSLFIHIFEKLIEIHHS